MGSTIVKLPFNVTLVYQTRCCHVLTWFSFYLMKEMQTRIVMLQIMYLEYTNNDHALMRCTLVTCYNKTQILHLCYNQEKMTKSMKSFCVIQTHLFRFVYYASL